MHRWIHEQTAEAYLRHFYEIPAQMPGLPLPDEDFVLAWRDGKGRDVLDFLADGLGLPVFDFSWKEEGSLVISFAHTMGGRLPVITTGCHEDFRAMEALMEGRREKRELPLTVNAFTIEARAKSISRHRILLLNRAPYSNVPAGAMGLTEADWLERSRRLRCAHECAHYETLRLLGDMKNHALDEILADAMGQLAAFGSFSADRQRRFFGLSKGSGSCTGRLSFYTGKVLRSEREKVYKAVDRVLDVVEDEVNSLLLKRAEEPDILVALAGRSIAERLG